MKAVRSSTVHDELDPVVSGGDLQPDGTAPREERPIIRRGGEQLPHLIREWHEFDRVGCAPLVHERQYLVSASKRYENFGQFGFERVHA